MDTLTPVANLHGTLSADTTLLGTISPIGALTGSISAETADPYYEVSNQTGITICIG